MILAKIRYMISDACGSSANPFYISMPQSFPAFKLQYN